MKWRVEKAPQFVLPWWPNTPDLPDLPESPVSLESEQHNLRSYRRPQDILESYRWARIYKILRQKMPYLQICATKMPYLPIFATKMPYSHIFVSKIFGSIDIWQRAASLVWQLARDQQYRAAPQVRVQREAQRHTLFRWCFLKTIMETQFLVLKFERKFILSIELFSIDRKFVLSIENLLYR